MATVQIDNSTKEKLQQLARRRHRSEGEVVAELVHQVVPRGVRSIRDALAGQIADPLTPEDFDGLHEDMLKRYGPHEA